MSRQTQFDLHQRIANNPPKCLKETLKHIKRTTCRSDKKYHHLISEGEKRILARRFFFDNPTKLAEYDCIINSYQDEPDSGWLGKRQIESRNRAHKYISDKFSNGESVVFPLDKDFPGKQVSDLKLYVEFNQTAFDKLWGVWSEMNFAYNLVTIVRLQIQRENKHFGFQLDELYPIDGRYEIFDGITVVRK